MKVSDIYFLFIYAFVFRVAKVQRVQTEIEQADLEKHEALLYSFQTTLGDTEESYHLTLSELLATIKDRKLQDDARLQIEVQYVVFDTCWTFFIVLLDYKYMRGIT